ncbi:DUF2268 domain-containing putative Zn-dependent protease [Bacteroidota bacterium]
MKKLVIIFTVLSIIITFSCKRKSDGNIKLPDHVKADVEILRYEKALFTLDVNNIGPGLRKLDKQYHVFIQGNYSDTLKLMDLKSYLTDTNMINIFDACQKEFPELKQLEEEFSEVFGYLLHYFPGTSIPKIYSYVSGINYEQPVDFLDSLLLIGLDNYLGTDFIYYKWYRIPEYRSENMSREYLIPDCIHEIARSKTDFRNSNRTLLDRMIYEGKLLYFADLMLPETNDAYKIGFTQDQLAWCEKYQADIWSFFIEEDLIFSTDIAVINKFILDGPFTGSISKEAPAKLGVWIGWQIVRKYMNENPGLNLNELLIQADAQKILQESRYKPRK